MLTCVVLSGGEAPGVNALLARYVALAGAHGDEALGAVGGFAGLLAGNLVPLTAALLNPLAASPGSCLPSSREPVLGTPDAPARLRAQLAAHGVDNLLLFGGDGSLRHLPPILRAVGIPYIGIPTTIDNNVPGTEQTLGFDSACNFAYQALDGILATAHALPGRIFMVETLGGGTGFLALQIALGAGAHAVLIPEYGFDQAWLNRRLADAVAREGYALLVLSEGVPESRTLAQTIAEQTQIRVRDTRLGHAQRGAKPSHQDRVLAAQMADCAHDALRDGTAGAIILMRNHELVAHAGPLDSFPAPHPDAALYNRINGLGGDAPSGGTGRQRHA
ncbi:MAG: 6-phosphofructokinase [Anaerolineae bacterium]